MSLIIVPLLAATTGFVPTGATIGAGGYATILSAPADAAAVRAAPINLKRSNRHWYGEQYGISDAEAAARLAAQSKLQAKFIALSARLRREQKGNFIGSMLRHEPDWAYVFVFKRNPANTLARYTR